MVVSCSLFPAARRKRLSRVCLAACLVLAAAPGAGSRASRVRSLDLPEMVRAAGTIFSGRVLKTAPHRIHNLPATRVTFKVEESLRGAAADEITLTFLGGVRPGGIPYRAAGLPVFRPGERLVLLAYPASSLGLTSPVGLDQGRFRVSQGAAGVEQVIVSAPGRRIRQEIRIERGRAPGTAAAQTRTAAGGSAGETVLYQDFMSLLHRLVDRDDARRKPHLEAPTGPVAGP
ncbi:MAG: hypothetical protein ACE5HD_02435 [Acidobacteriota bacterium]